MSRNLIAQFEINSRSSFTPVVITVGGIGMLIGLTSDLWAPLEWSAISELSSALCVCSLIAWLVQVRWPRAGQWLMVATFAAIVLWGGFTIQNPAFLTLLVLPNILAASLLDFRAALLLTGVETVWLGVSLLRSPEPNSLIALFIIWTCLLVLRSLTVSMHRTAQWAWDYYQNGLSLRKETFAEQGQLTQALEDLTRANLQLTRLNKLAQSLRQSAEGARAAKEQFVANVSHELRTPLNMIIGFSETMLQSPETYGRKLPTALLADLTIVHRNAEHLSALIDDILDLSQVEMGEMMIVREPVRFEDILDEVFTAVSPLFHSRALYLRKDVQVNLPVVFCDQTRMREVLLNLLSNAGRFTEQGGVQVSAQCSESQLQVSVADTGPGIKAEDMQKLFQPFYQVDGSIRRRFGGSGLGLSISKRFIELHDGRIWVESIEGVGSTFSFSIPIRPAVPLEGGVLSELVPDWEFHKHPNPHRTALAPDLPRLVVVESGSTLQRILSRALEGVELVGVADLDQAVLVLSKDPAQALLVNDLAFPASLAHLAAETRLPEGIPVLVCSVAGLAEENKALGTLERLIKPVQREQLEQSTQRLGISAGTVLVVDDDPDTIQLLSRMLASYQQDFRVISARSGLEALDILKDVRPDLILLDLYMPGMDGVQFLSEKNNTPAHHDIPVIVISAYDFSRRPMVSRALTLTQAGGLSVTQILRAIRFSTGELLATAPAADPARPEIGPD